MSANKNHLSLRCLLINLIKLGQLCGFESSPLFSYKHLDR